MATVVFSAELRRHTGGVSSAEVGAGAIRDVIAELARRWPALGAVLARGVAVAIDGEIISDPMLEPVGARSEVHFLPQIGGG